MQKHGSEEKPEPHWDAPQTLSLEELLRSTRKRPRFQSPSMVVVEHLPWLEVIPGSPLRLRQDTWGNWALECLGPLWGLVLWLVAWLVGSVCWLLC